LIVEGESSEPELFNKLVDFYLNNAEVTFEVFSYKTNLYDLYSALSKDDFLDIIHYLNENKNASLKRYNEIYIVFDLDIHHTNKQKFNIYTKDKISKMLKFFCDPFDKGELFLNYPMIESFKDITSYDINEYLKLDIKRTDSIKYKQIVANKPTLIKGVSELSKNMLNFMISINSIKSNWIMTGDSNKPSKQPNQADLFSKIEEKYIKSNRVPVLNTMLTFPILFFGVEDIQKFLKNNDEI